MARKTAIDKLNAEIADILSEYAEEVEKNVNIITAEIGKKGAQALRSQSRQVFRNGTGEYANGWAVDNSGTSHRVIKGSSVIYNKDHYQLAHLLEHGHVSRNGTGRTFGDVPGREHIAPVEKELVETFQREVVSKL